MDKLLQKNKTQILISSWVLISWGPGEETGGVRRRCCNRREMPRQVISEYWHWGNNFSQKCIKDGCGMSCDKHSFPSWFELFPPISKWGSTCLGGCGSALMLLQVCSPGLGSPRLCSPKVCSPGLALPLPEAPISRSPHPWRGSGGSLGMKHDALVPRCQIFPISSNVVPPVAMETRGSSAHMWSCLQVAVGYQGRSVMCQAAEGFSFPIKMLALS